MSALYRKYRPLTFSDVIAQEAVTRTLTNQIKTGRISHAYLFTGSRGTGKTTCARIFARAINCTNPQNGSPCGKCKACLSLQKSNIDIVELDAASNNGVDQMRENIIDNVQYPPVEGKYKVYIIDEVHMLSVQAFNALLKTLEEPPSHCVFILATTEVHKLPATVLSRCMRFDFALVPLSELISLCARVFDAENIKATPEAITLIATTAEGSVRDMLSIADRCLSFSTSLGYDDVLSVIGASGRDGSRKLFFAMANCDISQTLAIVDKLCASGKSVSLIAKDLCAFARDLLLLKTSLTASVLASPEERARLVADSELVSIEFLVSTISAFSAVDAELRYSVSPRIALECTALKVAKLASVDLSALEERIARIERAIASGNISVASNSENTFGNSAQENRANATKKMDVRSVWGRLLTHFRINESPSALALLQRVAKVESGNNNTLVIWADSTDYLRLAEDGMISAIRSALSIDGAPYLPIIKKVESGIDMDDEIAKLKRIIGDAKLNIKN